MDNTREKLIKLLCESNFMSYDKQADYLIANGVTVQKRITCPECKGNGYITLTRMYHDYCGIGNKKCDHCSGKGFLEVPMTNADRIRAMSNEELATKLFLAYQTSCEYDCGDISSRWCDFKGGCMVNGVEGECNEEKLMACILRSLESEVSDDG